MANFFENVVGNFEDVVQYNKDNREFEGAKNTNVTIETLCSIMTKKEAKAKSVTDRVIDALGKIDGGIQDARDMSDVDAVMSDMKNILEQSFLNDNDSQDKSAYERIVDVNSFALAMNGEECFEHRYDKMIEELSDTDWGSEAGVGMRQWQYQTCTEFGWYQSSDQPGNPYSGHFPVEFLEKQCTDIFGAKFDLKLLEKGIRHSNINYGAKNIEVSNVVFVHGSIDPWHAMGITKDLR